MFLRRRVLVLVARAMTAANVGNWACRGTQVDSAVEFRNIKDHVHPDAAQYGPPSSVYLALALRLYLAACIWPYLPASQPPPAAASRQRNASSPGYCLLWDVQLFLLVLVLHVLVPT